MSLLQREIGTKLALKIMFYATYSKLKLTPNLYSLAEVINGHVKPYPGPCRSCGTVSQYCV